MKDFAKRHELMSTVLAIVLVFVGLVLIAGGACVALVAPWPLIFLPILAGVGLIVLGQMLWWADEEGAEQAREMLAKAYFGDDY